jgi:meiotically up-regulated gene 157 (Mug157) protein
VLEGGPRWTGLGLPIQVQKIEHNMRLSRPRPVIGSKGYRGTELSLLCLLGVVVVVYVSVTSAVLRRLEQPGIKREVMGPSVSVPLLDGFHIKPTGDKRPLLPPSIWTSRQLSGPNAKQVSQSISSNLTEAERNKTLELCGKFLFSSMEKAIQVGDMGEQTYVATGDIDDMWIRDSSVQMSLYINRQDSAAPFLRLIVEGAIRRNAFNIIQDPYGNAFGRNWKDPKTLDVRDQVIGRGGWVSTRNYELDSGAYFMTQLYDYYLSKDLYRPEALLQEPIVFEAVLLMVTTWIVEQHHEELSPYRYFEIPRDGLGTPTGYTGMTWTGFRPSDDAGKYGYLVPANIFAAGSLERMLVLNERIWHSDILENMVTKLLADIEEGIQKFGIITTDDGERVYAFEVDGLGHSLHDFDDANVPSLLSIPLLGWSGYDRQVYQVTRKRILSKLNKHYIAGRSLKGIGSEHTHGGDNVWPMALVIQALTEQDENKVDGMVFQIRQLLASACDDAMHESVSSTLGCPHLTRPWFEWVSFGGWMLIN